MRIWTQKSALIQPRTGFGKSAVLSLPIQGFSTLHAALDDFVAGETLTGDNAYSCEICGRKVGAAGDN